MILIAMTEEAWRGVGAGARVAVLHGSALVANGDQGVWRIEVDQIAGSSLPDHATAEELSAAVLKLDPKG